MNTEAAEILILSLCCVLHLSQKCRLSLAFLQWCLPLTPTLGRQRQAELCELQASLVYIVHSRTARATQCSLSPKTKKAFYSQLIAGLLHVVFLLLLKPVTVFFYTVHLLKRMHYWSSRTILNSMNCILMTNLTYSLIL